MVSTGQIPTSAYSHADGNSRKYTLRIRGGMMAMPNSNAPGGNGVYGTPRQDTLDLNRIPELTLLSGIYFFASGFMKLKSPLICKLIKDHRFRHEQLNTMIHTVPNLVRLTKFCLQVSRSYIYWISP